MRWFLLWMGSGSLNENSSGRGESEGLLVDRTAGRLARWLRILGLDTDYAATCDTAVIARLARQSGRTVITRNRAVVERLKGQGILLVSEHLEDQVRQVLDKVGRRTCAPFSKCSICNADLVPVPKDSVRGRVPDYVYRHHDHFASCPVCGRYYWRGTHWQLMHQAIEKMIGGGRDGDG